MITLLSLIEKRYGIWPYPDVARPELPEDLNKPSNWTANGDRMRKSYDCRGDSYGDLTPDQIEQFNGLRQTLWGVLTDVQRATWVHFGFIEVHEWKSGNRKNRVSHNMNGDDGFYRIHWTGSTGLTSVFDASKGRAVTGLCCFQRERRFTIEDTISNVLALRTDNLLFEDTACGNPVAEFRHEGNDYYERNLMRINRKREEEKKPVSPRARWELFPW